MRTSEAASATNLVTACPGPYRSRISASRVSRAHVITVWPRRHVAIQQGIAQQRVRGSELRRQLSAKAPDVSLDLGARVIGHQTHHLPVNTGTTQETRAIDRVKPGLRQLGRVPDVMKPRGRR